MKIIYIHGANSSHETFNHLREHVGGDDYAVDYSCQKRFTENLERLAETIDLVKDKIFFVGHSLGGLYALHLYDRLRDRVVGAVTISSPFGGSEVAQMLQYLMPSDPLMKDIAPSAWPVRGARKIKIDVPWTNIVSTVGGAKWVGGENDGVVTLASMRYRSDMELVDVPINHYEVVLHAKTIAIIKDRIAKAKTAVAA